MRNLNRIIFINSANIPYADDIYLDGNIHFIGTQGVGKSTILRAILFFYNADTQKLGIPVEKQSYTEYYFPYSNSYIVYEVATENGPFCILSFKSMNRVCYRFIDSPYRKEFFIDEESRTAYSGTDRIRAILDQYDVDYSRIIYTYDEYRNILYGNEAGADMQRYALMESKQYQNIPRTIQNVLLNSKLDAEFIKKTIISSLNEEDTSVDLNTYKEHLKNFETRLRDIEEFQKRETQKQAAEITRLATEVNRRQTALVQGCRELAAARIKAEEALPQWEEKKKQAENDRHIILARRMELQEQSKKKCDRLQEVLAVVNNELQKASQKEKEYDQLNISQIAERSAKKEEWKNHQNPPCRKGCSQSRQPGRSQMETLAYLIPSKEHDRNKGGFHKESNDPFDSKRSSENITDEPGIVTPVRSKLEFQDQSGGHPHCKINSKQTHPELNRPLPELISGTYIQCLHRSHHNGQSQSQWNKKPVIHGRQGKLRTRPVNHRSVDTFQHTTSILIIKQSVFQIPVSSFYQFTPYILLLLHLIFPFQKRRKEKQLQDKEHKKQFDQNQNPKCPANRHSTKTVTIKGINANDILFNHNLFL